MNKDKEIDEILDQLTKWFEKNEKKRTVMVVVSDEKEDFQISRFVLGNNKNLSIALISVMLKDELFAKVINEAHLAYFSGFWQEIENKLKSISRRFTVY